MKTKKLLQHQFFLYCFLFTILLLFIIQSCKKDEDITNVPTPIATGVNVDLASVPFQKLSDYRFFKGTMKDQIPNDGVIPFKPASGLFTDYALKKRFIWMPQGVKASYNGDHDILNFPVGTALIKNFYYDSLQPLNQQKIIETRIMIRKSTGWIFAEYVWNDEQTEAYLNMDGSYKNISFIENGQNKTTNYRIPSETECLTCHKDNNNAIPIGVKPQNLNFDFTYDDGVENQLTKLINVGYLENNLPGNIVSTIDYADVNHPLRLRLRSYLDANCAHCHRQNSHCSYRPLRLGFSETTVSLNMGICMPPDEIINPTLVEIIVPGNINKSVMHFRLNSVDEATRMPLLGRTLVHDEGLQLLKDFINSISNCD